MTLPSRSLMSALSAAATVLLLPAACVAQAPDAKASTTLTAQEQAVLIGNAQSKIYNMKMAGVKSFGCNVVVDWQATFKAIAGEAMPADDPRMKYLNSATLSFKQPIGGAAEVAWKFPPAAPGDADNKPLNLMTDGVKQMVEGFLLSWSPTFDGTLLPRDAGTTVKTDSSAGYTVQGPSGGTDTTVQLNRALEVTHVSAKGSAQGGSFDTVFSPTPKGLVLTSLHGSATTAAGAPPTHVTISTSYAPVGDVELPASLSVVIPNVVVFKMKFVDCTAQRDK